jgi:signal transduction histidine kinase
MRPSRHPSHSLRTARFTLGLMLFAASLVLLGGARLARREHVDRTPADRVRLQEFTDAFHAELERLAELFQGHLADTASAANPGDPAAARTLCTRVVGIRGLHLFGNRNSAELSISLPSLNRSPAPAVEIEGGKASPTFSKRLIVPASVFSSTTAKHGWLKSPDIRWQAYWQRVAPNRFVVLLIESERVLQAVNAHLTPWLTQAFAPIRESGELVRLRSSSGVLAGIASPPDSPMALTIPVRNLLGSWELSAWDRTRIRIEYSPAGLSIALCAGSLLALLGVLLFQQQRRALRLAEERVSFVNRVSHELGAPLTNSQLNLSLAEDFLDLDPDRARSRLLLVSEEMHRLARLVANVLTFSKTERGTLTLSESPCIPDAVIAGMLAQFEPAFQRRRMRVDCQPGAPHTVLCSPDALAQITGNLLSNAEKYGHSGGWVQIQSHWTEGILRVRVSDGGPGIPEKDRERIFEPFERVGSQVDEGASGTGLGLSIARELAIRMGGSLRLLSPPQGAAFELQVPAPGIQPALQSLPPA